MHSHWERLARILIIGALCAATVAPLAHALDLERRFSQFRLTNWGADNGLPSQRINAIVETNDGYVWLGTYSGLARFDGVRFTIYDPANSPLPRSEILSLAAASDGSLWVGTPGGAAHYTHGHFERIVAPASAQDAAVTSIAESGGRIWLAYYGAGLYYVEGNQAIEVKGVEAPLKTSVRSLARDSDGGVFAATRGGVVYVSKKLEAGLLDGAATGGVFCALQQPDGTLWAGSREHGLMRRVNGRWETVAFKREPPSPTAVPIILALLYDRSGTLWIATDNDGLIAFRDGKFIVYSRNEGLLEPRVLTVAQDHEGSIWIGMPVFGALQISEGRVLPHGTKEGVSWDITTGVMQARDGTLWAGTEGGGLNLLNNGVWRQITAPQVLKGTVPYALAETADGTVLVATDHLVLHRFRGQRLVDTLQIPGRGNPMAIAVDRAGMIWIGTTTGLHTYANGIWDANASASHPWNIAAGYLLPEADGGMQIATEEGLYTYFNGRVSQVHGTEHRMISTLATDASGALWAALDGVGLMRLRGSGKTMLFTTDDGLPETQLVALIDDGHGSLWLGGARGIYSIPLADLERYERGDHKPLYFERLSEEDGMRSHECSGLGQPSVWKARDGALWFTTMKGLARVEPTTRQRAQAAPPVSIEEITAAHTHMAPTRSELKLPAGSRDVDIRYTAMSYLSPKRLEFRYRMQGYDANWVYAGARREAYYTNLSPGRYVFQVQASTGGGTWTATGGAQIELEIQARWFETMLARALFVVLMFGIGTGALLWRVRLSRLREFELAAKVEARTKELREEINERRRAEERAEALARTKSDFLANMSHEMRTPMNSVIGMTSLLMETGLSEEQREYTDVVRASGTHLLAVINDILDYSKVESGTLVFENLPFRIDQCIREVFDLLSPLAKPKGIQLVCAFEEVPVAIRGDITRLRQILVNLVGNGIKFTSQGEVEVHVYPHAPGEPPLLRFEVRDTGIGIPPSRQTNLFLPFTQGDSSTTRRFGGTGLGLAICRRLVELMGGTIGVKSAPGQGSTFWFTLPAPAVDASSVPKPLRPTSIDTSLGTRLPMRILLAEDNPVNQKVGMRLLEKLGYHPDLAANGQEACDALRRQNYDMVLMDMQMPVMDGLQASRAIVDEYPLRTRPFIVAMTANVLESDRNACAEAGMDDFLGKPVLLSDLHRLLERASVQIAARRVGLHGALTAKQEPPEGA